MLCVKDTIIKVIIKLNLSFLRSVSHTMGYSTPKTVFFFTLYTYVIPTRYGLDGPGFETRWRIFPYPYRPARPTQPPVQWVPGLSRGTKRPGRGFNHPLPSCAKVKERVQLYLYSFSGPSWLVTGQTLPFSYVIQRRCINQHII